MPIASEHKATIMDFLGQFGPVSAVTALADSGSVMALEVSTKDTFTGNHATTLAQLLQDLPYQFTITAKGSYLQLRIHP